MEFPNPDDIMNFNVTLLPDEVEHAASCDSLAVFTNVLNRPAMFTGILERRQIHIFIFYSFGLSSHPSQNSVCNKGGCKFAIENHFWRKLALTLPSNLGVSPEYRLGRKSVPEYIAR